MKRIILVVLFVLCLISVGYAQTWTKRENLGSQFGDVDIEYTVITKQQYDRLLQQHTAMGEYANVQFMDELEREKSSGRVIKGKAPTFNGYYYLLCKTTVLNDSLKQALSLINLGTALIYGNSNTGVCSIAFGNSMMTLVYTIDVYLLGSDGFTRRYNQCIRFVNGE